MNKDSSSMYDKGNNLARECREFYERRVVMAESATRHWQAIESYNNINNNNSDNKVYSTIRRNKAGTIQSSSSTLTRSRTHDDENEPFVRLPLKIAQLRRELLSLVNLDNELFKHLLTLNDKIEDLRESSTSPKIIAKNELIVENPVPLNKIIIPDRVEEEEEEVENFDWPLSFEEAQMFASLPVTQPGFNNYTKTLPNATRRRRMADQQDETSGAMKFVLRSKSFLMRQPFQRKQISFPASRQNRGRKSGLESSRNLDEDQENEHNSSQSTLNRRTTTIAQDLHLPFSSLNLGGGGGGGSRPTGIHIPASGSGSQPLFNLPPSRFLWQKMFFNSNSSQTAASNGPESLPCQWYGVDDGGFAGKSLNHIKQNSFDSGIHHSDTEYSVKV